jgi:signal transduction histidine kinase
VKDGFRADATSALIPTGRNERLENAILYLKKCLALAKELKNLKVLQSCSKNLSEAYEGSGNYTEALYFYKLSAMVKDSIFNIDNSVMIHNLESKRLLDLKQKDIEINEKKIALDKLEIAKKRNERAYFIVALLLLIGIILVVANNYRVKSKSAQLVYEAELRTIEAEVREATLSNIGAELHDNVGQLLAVAHFQLEKEKLRHPENEPILNPASQTVQQVMAQVRLLSHSLSGDFVSEAGLQPSIANEIERLRTVTKLSISYETDEIEPQLSKNTRTVVFRMFQEIISNSLRHSNAENMEVRFLGDDFLLCIKDDGKGFDKDTILNQQKGFGLKNLFRRANLASLVCDIQSAPGEGTTFTITRDRPKKLL